ncbi:PRTRC system protein F [Cupriavidus sp. BIC8F]|uniref:PRTRC system protein F n=1 Tax=Cupriavidus sp. BIC8F TaxID=3079014 RepID=UPI00291636C0|nr:PRTRC system protein F [Cupriavidus sp. BIC8F]
MHPGQQPAWTPHRKHPAAGRRPAHDFLTLPRIPGAVPATARLRYGDELEVGDLVLAQFAAGMLRASEVSNPTSAGDAFAQAMFAWLGKRLPTCQRLQFGVTLIDRGAAMDQVMQFGWEDGLEAPLYLAIELPGEEVYAIGEARAQAIRAAHPSLLFTAMSLINAACGKSLFVRTPDVLLDQFARWHWDYDATLADDENAREFLKENFGGEDADIERYLPSVVRAELAPDDTLPRYAHVDAASAHLRELGPCNLRALARLHSGWVGELGTALADLRLLLARAGERSVIAGAQWAEPAYSAATIAYLPSDYVSEILDDHYECLNNAGDATMFQCFIPLADDAAAIRQQFRDLADMLQIIGALDRVLTLISS